MMGLGPMGSGAGGNSSSSISNLSALAPPFTVDKLSPKPNSNPNLRYSDAPYTAEPYSHGWPYPSPSAPIPELLFDSTGIDSLPLSSDYGYSPLKNISPTGSTHWSGLGSGTKPASASVFAYSGGGDVKPYYSPYDTSLVGEDNVGTVPGKSESDYGSCLFDADYGGRWVDNLGFDDGKRAKRVEQDGSFFEKANHGYANHLNQGGFGTEKNKKISTEHSENVSYQIFNQTPDRELHTGPPLTSVTRMEDKSCLEQNLGFYPYDTSKTRTSAYIPNNFSNEQSSFEKSVKPAETSFRAPISAMMTSPTIVIRPPPTINGSYGQRTSSAKPTQFENVEGTQNVVFGLNANSQLKEDSFEANLFNTSFDRQIISRFGSLTDVNVLGGFNTASGNNYNNLNLSENCSDFIDHNSTVTVDSPCWKGASSSQFPPFDIESGCTSNNHSKRNADEKYYGFDSLAFPEKTGEIIKNDENETNKELSMPKKESVHLSSGFISEGAVAVHVAEKVLASPASQEDVTEGITVPEGRKLDVPTVLKAMHSLSELLMSCVLSDGCSLEEASSETLKNTIVNLHSCLSNNKTMESSKKPKARNQVGDDFDKLQEARDVGSILGSPLATNEPLVSQIKLGSQHMRGEESSYNFPGKKDENRPIVSSLGHIDMDIDRGDDMTMAIKKVLEENFHINEEINSQALLFKNLWFDAEAKLCSISYKARFDRMRIQMEQIKIRAPQEDRDIEETKSEVCISPDGVTASELGHDGSTSKPTPQNVSIPSMSGPVDASVMARFSILKSREDNAKPINTEDKRKPKMVDCAQDGSSIMARFNILKSRDENLTSTRSIEEEKQSKRIVDGELSCEKYAGLPMVSRSEDEAFNLGPNDGGKFGPYILGAGYEDLDEFHLSVPKDPIVHSFKSIGGMIDRNRLGRRDSSPSDWEHVLKDDFSWKNM